jgi:hypothetical protein
MKTARTALLLACVAALMVAAVSPALAAEAADVTATVETETISCTVTPGTVDFGVAPTGGTFVKAGPITVTNTGNVSETFRVTTSKASLVGSPAVQWSAPDTGPGTDAFALTIDTTPTASGTPTIVTETQTLFSSLPYDLNPTDSDQYELDFLPPVSSTIPGIYTFTITFTALSVI